MLENEAKSKAEELAKVLGILLVSQRLVFFSSLPDVSIAVFIKAVWFVFRFMACGFPIGLQYVFYAARSG